MDLNIYLTSPRSHHPYYSLDIGSDSAEESISSVAMPIELQFPLHPEYSPELPAILTADSLPSTEDTPYFLAYESPYRVSLFPSTMPSHAGETVAYSPSGSGIPQYQADDNVSLYAPTNLQLDDLISAEDTPYLRPEPIRCPHSRFRRMIESSSRSSNRRLRSSVAYTGERSSLRSSSLPTSEHVLRDAAGPARGRETNASNKVHAENIAAETSKEKRDDKDESAGFFECNICFDMATEPVVTSCGHLFCWPCLYQWLHIHSGYNECPVCKGEVTEDNITPIYGRGNSSNEKDKIEEPESSVKIPARPRGSRIDSFRQQFQQVAGQFNDGIAPWWHLTDYMPNRHRYGPRADPTQSELFDIDQHATVSRSRTRRLHRHLNFQNAVENVEHELLPGISNIQNPASIANSVFQDGVDFWHPLYLNSEEMIAADVISMIGHLTSNSHIFGAPTSAAEPSIPDLNESLVSAEMDADQISASSMMAVSASSTMAVIQGDYATSIPMPDPNSAETSPSHRRKRRSSSVGSFDDDRIRPCERRRLN